MWKRVLVLFVIELKLSRLACATRRVLGPTAFAEFAAGWNRMSKPYDATTKVLLEENPAAWLRLAGIEVSSPITLLESDLSTITTDADKLFRVEADDPWIVHLELQSGHDSQLPLRGVRYGVLADYAHGLPVQTVFVLLRPAADSPAFTGELRRCLPDGFCYLSFHYRVVRVWELPVERLLHGDLATLPLAPIASATEDQIPEIIRQMKTRLDSEATTEQARSLWTATYILMGLKFPTEFLVNQLRGVNNMKESVSYQAIIEEGLAKGRTEGRTEGSLLEARRLLVQFGQRRLGVPGAAVRERIDSIDDLDRLEHLLLHVVDFNVATTWDELLDGTA